MKNCTICNKELVKQQVKFCSNTCKQKAHYNKHVKSNTNTSFSQYKRADLRKAALIDKLGGKCSICGYNKNQAALHFHHLRDKSFGLDARNIGNRSMNSILEELDKCILVCANCHAEIHYPNRPI